MHRLRLTVMLVVTPVLGLGATGSSVAGGTATKFRSLPSVVVVAPVLNLDGEIALTLSCADTVACAGRYSFPKVRDQETTFAIAAHAKKTLHWMIDGGNEPILKKAKRLEVKISQQRTGRLLVSDRFYALSFQRPVDLGPVSARNGNDGPVITPGPPTRYQVVHDRAGDGGNRFDILSATAKRVGNAIIFTVTSTQALGEHDGYGNAITPCVEIPFRSPVSSHYPMFLFGSAEMLGNGAKIPTKLAMHVSGHTVQWTVPRIFLFKYGFVWRATGGCDVHDLSDLAPGKGFMIFRWVKVTTTH